MHRRERNVWAQEGMSPYIHPISCLVRKTYMLILPTFNIIATLKTILIVEVAAKIQNLRVGQAILGSSEKPSMVPLLNCCIFSN